MRAIELINIELDSNENFRGSIRKLPPLELIYIKEILKKKYAVSINEFQTNIIPDLYIVCSAPNYLFWRCPPLDFTPLYKLIKKIRLKSHTVPILLIGPHGQFQSELFYSFGVDYILVGEAEASIMSYVDNIFNKTAEKLLIGKEVNMDILPDLVYGKIAPYQYYSHNSLLQFAHSITYEISRGCTNKCLFCNRRYFRGKYREKSWKHVFMELNKVFIQQEIDYIYFIDENFGLNNNLLKQIGYLLNDNNVKWGCQTNIGNLTEDKLLFMRNNGCISIEFGIESFDNEILRTNKKHTDVKKAIKILEFASSIELNPLCFFLVFLPGETKQTMINSFNILTKIRGSFRVSFGAPYPYPGTEIWKIGKNEGKFTNENWNDVVLNTGKIGHNLDINIEKLNEFLKKYGPNHFTNPDFFNLLYNDLFGVING